MGLVERIRKRTYEVMEVGRPGDQLSRTVDSLIMLLVAGNVLAIALESVKSLHSRYEDVFLAFEQVSIAVFSIELVCRFWAAREVEGGQDRPWRSRLRYLVSPMAIIDILSIAPFYLASFFSLDLRFLRILRLLRLLKLTRYSRSMNLMLEVFRIQRGALATAFFFLSIAIVVSACVLHLVEQHAQPEAFGSIPAAMWWAICTLTTVGYGDVTPVTTLGKLLTSVITIVGIGMVALPTSILASGFDHVMDRNERALEEEAEGALADGVITQDEANTYEILAETLHVEPDIAREIIEAVQRRQSMIDGPSCPHCGKSISS